MVFGSLIELHAWLHSCLCFFLLKKLILKASSTSPRHLAICRASKFFLIAISTPPRHLVDRSSLISCVWCFCTSTLARHLYLSAANSLTPSSTPYSTPLDLSRSFCLHCFSHVLHISFILSSIASFFITSMHLYWFFVPPWSSLIIFIFLGWSFLASCTICQSWQKRGEIGKYVLSF